MCGRYVLDRGGGALAAELDAADATDGLVQPQFNIPPTTTVPVVIAVRGQRRLGLMAWGIRGEHRGKPSLLFNSRLESLLDKPSRRTPSRRCLVPATGYYEWHTTGGVRTPYLITDPASPTLTMAGLYDGKRRSDGSTDWAFSIVTTAATAELTAIHHRRPVIVPGELRDAWLDPTTPLPDVLRELDSGQRALRFHAVGPQVGDVRNNDPSLLTAVQL
jgi:putative SOS response-associated peptidase YedK